MISRDSCQSSKASSSCLQLSLAHPLYICVASIYFPVTWCCYSNCSFGRDLCIEDWISQGIKKPTAGFENSSFGYRLQHGPLCTSWFNSCLLGNVAVKTNLSSPQFWCKGSRYYGQNRYQLMKPPSSPGSVAPCFLRLFFFPIFKKWNIPMYVTHTPHLGYRSCFLSSASEIPTSLVRKFYCGFCGPCLCMYALQSLGLR